MANDPADISEVHLAILLLQKTKATLFVPIGTANGDVYCDSEKVLCFIIEDLNAHVIIPRNPGTKQGTPCTLKAGYTYCQAISPYTAKAK